MAALDQIRLKLDRADRHVQELEAALLAFKKNNPYKVGTKVDEQTQCLVYYITQAEEIPAAISLIAGDVLQNLRTALDHLAWQLVPAGGRNSQTAFPISDDVIKYSSDKVRKISGMPEAAVDAIDATKPFKGGNDAIWRLHRLNNIDKHRLLVTVGASFRSVNVSTHIFGEMLKAGIAMHLGLKPGRTVPVPNLHLRPKDNLFPLKVGSELFIDLPGAEVNPKMNFLIDVAFGEPNVCEGEPVLETLKNMSSVVGGIVSDFTPLLS
jgi:hypothetical protein